MKRAKSCGWLQQCKEFVKGKHDSSRDNASALDLDREAGFISDSIGTATAATRRPWRSADQLYRKR